MPVRRLFEEMSDLGDGDGGRSMAADDEKTVAAAADYQKRSHRLPARGAQTLLSSDPPSASPIQEL
jgi:hypothetical protein